MVFEGFVGVDAFVTFLDGGENALCILVLLGHTPFVAVQSGAVVAHITAIDARLKQLGEQPKQLAFVEQHYTHVIVVGSEESFEVVHHTILYGVTVAVFAALGVTVDNTAELASASGENAQGDEFVFHRAMFPLVRTMVPIVAIGKDAFVFFERKFFVIFEVDMTDRFLDC